MEDIIMINNIKSLIAERGINPHQLSKQTDITYRIVLKLCKAETIPPTTPIRTLDSIARVLDVSVDDLYSVEAK